MVYFANSVKKTYLCMPQSIKKGKIYNENKNKAYHPNADDNNLSGSMG
jgi:hypothetical protein